MAFFTSFFLYRPTKPPRVRPGELAKFIEKVAESGVLAPGEMLGAKVKFGRAIDRDDKEMTFEVPAGRGIARVIEKPWDLEAQPRSMAELVATLRRYDRPIYRAHLPLGAIEPDLAAYINHCDGPPEPSSLRLEEWSVAIGPVETYALESDEAYFVGWIKLGMHGWGYPYPVTVPELVRRAEAHPKLAALKELCRSTWPVTAEPVRTPPWWLLPHRRRRHAQDMRGGAPSRRVMKLRRKMGRACPHDSIEREFDWEWGIGETG